jgi:hypothetical protein
MSKNGIKSNNTSIYSQKRAFSRFLSSDTHAFERGQGYKMATAGVLVSNGHKVLFNGDTELSHFSQSEHEQMRRIAVCREMYENVGLVGNIIDLMVDFALEDLTIEHTSDAIRNIYINWARMVDLPRIAEGFLKAYYRDGNVPIFKMRGTLKPEEVQKMRKRVIAEDNKSLSQFIPDNIERNRIPIRYRILNVLSLKKQGSDLLGTTHYHFQVHRDERKVINSAISTEDESAALERFKNSVGEKAFDLFTNKGLVRLNKDQLDVIHYKKDDWQPWATPMLWRISPDVKFKQLLRDADISLAEGVINSLIVIKLGNAEKGFHPSPGAYRKMTDMMKNPARSKTIVWDDLIQIEHVFPPVEKMLSEDKYRQVNQDILSGIGVPEFLINGAGGKGGFANAFLAARTLLERLEPGRKLFVDWVKEQFEEIRSAFGFQKPAWVKMHNTSLKDQEVEQRFLLEMLDRNLISARTLIERADENFDIEIQRMRKEDNLRDQFEENSPLTLRKLGKFGPQIQPTLIEMMDEEQEADGLLPSAQEEQGNNGGRPKGTRRRRTREQGPRKPKGRNVANMTDLRKLRKQIGIKFSKIYAFINDQKLVDQKYIYDAVTKVLAHTDGLNKISKKHVIDVINNKAFTEGGVKLERCVKNVIKQRIKKFRDKNGKDPSAEKMKDIESSAFAICKSQNLK